MRVLLVHDYGTPTGGAENQVLALRNSLRDRGHEVKVFASSATPVPAEPFADYLCFGTMNRLQVLSQAVNPSAYFTLKDALADFRPDVVHVRMFLWQLSPAILPLLREYPSLYQTALYKCVCPTGTKLLPDYRPCRQDAGWACVGAGCVTPQTLAPVLLQLALFRRWRGVFRRIVALSHNMKEELNRAGISPVIVVHNGVAPRPQRPPLSGAPIVGYAGRLAKEKGVDILMEAFARVAPGSPGTTLWIAGDGPQRRQLEELAALKGIADRVTFWGYLTRTEMEKLFDRVWIQAIPSLFNEPFGNVATEAMMRGTAVVTSRTGGLAESVADGVTGWHVTPANVDELANALQSLLADRALVETMGEAGRARALSEFTLERCAERFEEIYEEIRGE